MGIDRGGWLLLQRAKQSHVESEYSVRETQQVMAEEKRLVGVRAYERIVSRRRRDGAPRSRSIGGVVAKLQQASLPRQPETVLVSASPGTWTVFPRSSCASDASLGHRSLRCWTDRAWDARSSTHQDGIWLWRSAATSPCCTCSSVVPAAWLGTQRPRSRPVRGSIGTGTRARPHRSSHYPRAAVLPAHGRSVLLEDRMSVHNQGVRVTVQTSNVPPSSLLSAAS